MSAVYVGRGHKYAAKRCTEHTPAHASLRECRRAQELMLMERAGLIRNLRQQVRMNLCEAITGECAHKRPIVYVADFVYEEPEITFADGVLGWHQVVEDAKGVETPVFKIKRHLLADQGVEVRVS